MSKRFTVLLSSLVLTLAAACGGSSSGTGSPGPGSGTATPATKAPATPAGFLGGIFRVDLKYDSFVFGDKCGPNAVTPFSVSYRASADGSNVTFKNLGQGFDMIGSGQPDGTLSLAGGYSPTPGLQQNSTLKGSWNQKNLDLAATIDFIATQQGGTFTCTVQARATGPVTTTT